MKTCNTCKEVKTLDLFPKRSASRDGLNASCKKCVSIRKSTYESTKAYSKKYYAENSEERKEKKRLWDLQNRKHVNAYKSEYRKKEPLKHTVWEATKRTKRKQRLPKWLTEAHNKDIQAFYWLARDLRAVTGEEYQVDHIVPLLGKDVCGLHVPWNLQVLPSDINNKKNNCFVDNTQGDFK